MTNNSHDVCFTSQWLLLACSDSISAQMDNPRLHILHLQYKRPMCYGEFSRSLDKGRSRSALLLFPVRVLDLATGLLLLLKVFCRSNFCLLSLDTCTGFGDSVWLRLEEAFITTVSLRFYSKEFSQDEVVLLVWPRFHMRSDVDVLCGSVIYHTKSLHDDENDIDASGWMNDEICRNDE
ncbi:hypothetical protein Tco_0214665 [Tanacetum coccineum]